MGEILDIFWQVLSLTGYYRYLSHPFSQGKKSYPRHLPYT